MPSAEKDFDNNAAPNAEGGLSLDDLNAAFAGMLSGGDDPYCEPPVADDTPVAQEVVAGGEGDEDDDTSCDITPLTILEAMLFVGGAGGEPLTSLRVSSLMRGVRPAEIDDLVRDLNDRYETDGRPYRIENAGEGYRLTLREEFSAVVDKLQGRNRQARLTPAAIEVLSLVAYNGPQTADDLTRLRGRPSGAVLSQLVRRQLLRVERDEADRRLTRYVTTPRFLAVLGIEKLDDLPRSQDVERR
ncbi:MAG TPA: SMC-Scp complex subunit ScpB [Pirellulales bacterium]